MPGGFSSLGGQRNGYETLDPESGVVGAESRPPPPPVPKSPVNVPPPPPASNQAAPGGYQAT
jgi:hypothetical protein